MSVFEQDQFYGRKVTLELLKRRVLDLKEGYRQNMAFLGDRYTGKTMIVQKFLADLDDAYIIPLYVDLEKADLSYFFYKLSGSLLYHYGRNRGLAVNEDLNFLMGVMDVHLPETIKAMKKIQVHLNHGREREAYLETISLPQIFTQEANVYCVLLLDEFQHLEDFGITDEFQELGKRIMTQRRCLYVVTSSLLWSAQKILSEKLSLLFGNFEIIEIQPFDSKTSQDFVRYQLNGVRMSDTLVQFLIDFSGGHPLYLTLICQQLQGLCALHKQSEIFLPLLTSAMEEILNQRWGVLNRHFELMVERVSAGKGNLMMSQILLSLANGRQKVGELATGLNLKQAATTQRLNRLLELGIVAKNGNYYYLPDKLFKYWLRFVFYKRRRLIGVPNEQHQAEFRQEFSRSFESSRANAQKDLSSQVVELLSCFENESLSMNGRRYKLPVFHQMTPSHVMMGEGEGLELIRALSDEGEWLIILKSGILSDNDMNQLLLEAKKFMQKPQRCVLISLDHLDESARVRALQERMWIWNEGELNTLSAIFDKSLIARPVPSAV